MDVQFWFMVALDMITYFSKKQDDEVNRGPGRKYRNGIEIWNSDRLCCFSFVQLAEEWLGYLRKVGVICQAGTHNKRVITFALNFIGILLACQSASAAKVDAFNNQLRKDFDLIGVCDGLTIEHKYAAVLGHQDYLNTTDGGRIKKVKHSDTRFHINHESTDHAPLEDTFEGRHDHILSTGFPHTAMINLGAELQENAEYDAFTFDVTTSEFGLDSCSTTHTCFDESLFTPGTVEELEGSGVEGAGGRSEVTKRGSVAIRIKSDDGDINHLVLENVAFVPGSPKNLISISQWEDERKDDVELRCKGKFSIFHWENYSKMKCVHHHPACKTPLLEVQIEDKKGFMSFCSLSKETKTNNMCMLASNRSQLEETAIMFKNQDQIAAPEPCLEHKPKSKCTVDSIQDEYNSDQQFDDVNVLEMNHKFEPGELLEWSRDGSARFVEILEQIKSHAEIPMHNVRIFKTNRDVTTPEDMLHPILPVASMPNTSKDVDVDMAENELTSQDIDRLWKNQTHPASDDETLWLHWHQKLQHPPKKVMNALAKRGVNTNAEMREQSEKKSVRWANLESEHSPPPAASEQMREDSPFHMQSVDFTSQVENGDEVNTAEVQDSPFAQLDSLGLRRSPRLAEPAGTKTQEELFKDTSSLGLITPAVKFTGSIQHTIKRSFTHQIALHNDFINRNFDGASNQMNPISFLTESASDNETYAFTKIYPIDTKLQIADIFYQGITQRSI